MEINSRRYSIAGCNANFKFIAFLYESPALEASGSVIASGSRGECPAVRNYRERGIHEYYNVIF